LFARRPSFTWDVLNSTSHLWLRDPQGITDPGLVAISTVTNAELKAFMFEVLRNKELAPAAHNSALKILIEGGQNWEAVEEILRNKDAPRGLRATAIEYAPRQPAAKIRTFLEQFGVSNLDEPSQSVLIGALKEKGGEGEMHFLRKLAVETSLPSNIRQAAAQAADEMSKRIK